MFTLILHSALAGAVPALPTNRRLDVLPAASPSEQLQAAAEKLGAWEFDLAGVPINGTRLLALHPTTSPETLEQRLREDLGRPVDLTDFIYLLDDILFAEDRRGERLQIHSGRARSSGVLLHPDDIFRHRPRKYPRKKSLPVDAPTPQAEIKIPAADGDLPGPAWTARYKNPATREQMLKALKERAPDSDFSDRIKDLLSQLESEGAEVYLASTARSPERGYLMWGAFTLSRAGSEAELTTRLLLVNQRNKDWKLNIPIQWSHPDGWRATVEATRQMADTYDVVYATERGARSSNHYGGDAADLIGLDLPRRLTLTAPDGACRSFDLSDPSEPRDLSLTPRLIDWIEHHWSISKLRSDYPHWNDAKK